MDQATTFLSFLWIYFSDLYILAITSLSILSMVIPAWPTRLTTSENRAIAIALVATGFFSVRLKQ